MKQMDEDMQVLNDLFLIWESNVYSTKEKLEGGSFEVDASLGIEGGGIEAGGPLDRIRNA